MNTKQCKTPKYSQQQCINANKALLKDIKTFGYSTTGRNKKYIHTR